MWGKFLLYFKELNIIRGPTQVQKSTSLSESVFSVVMEFSVILLHFVWGERQRGEVAEMAADLILVQNTQLEDSAKVQTKESLFLIADS